MKTLPNHGRVDCTECYPSGHVTFGETIYAEGQWRITANPLAWGNPKAEVIVLGFSKGPTQAGALAHALHNDIAYKGRRHNMGKILAHVGLLTVAQEEDHAEKMTKEITSEAGRFHFGSLIRCTVERYEDKTDAWKGSGGGMLDLFLSTSFGKQVARNCTSKFLSQLPAETRLIVMFGLGSRLNYVKASFALFQAVRAGEWQWLSEIAYTDGKVTVVHVEHFASQGALIPHWMGKEEHARGKYGRLAQEAVAKALGKAQTCKSRDAVIPKVITANLAAVDPGPKNLNPVKGAELTNETNPSGREGEFSVVRAAILRSGYRAMKDTVKLAEFCSPSDKTIYVLKSSTTLNHISLMVHPGLHVELLSCLNGAGSISSEHRYHSGMSQFPARINNGKTEITYGWKISIETLGDMESFLQAFDALPDSVNL